MKKINSVDDYINHHKKWQKELLKLREIAHTTEMQETLKWSSPVYTVNNKNIVGIGAFKNYVGIWFFQGVFLKDKNKVLINAQEDKTIALRQWKFQSIDEMDEKLIKFYLEEAIQNQKEGKEIKPQKKEAITLPPELKTALSKSKELQIAFSKFSPYKQREFTEYIYAAKQENTKLSRLEKIVPMILKGLGLNDKYRS